ncbi:MAG: hypothetical protein WCR24_00730 [Candidatus Methanomethylophilaceae archaeon]
MAMIDIEYRYSNRPLGTDQIRRTTVYEMECYIRDIVTEMQSADISVRFDTGFAVTGERNMVYINGRSVPDILDGLKIVIPEEDENNCGCEPRKPIKFERPIQDWKKEYIEDIPDMLMKNAISKIYSEMEANRIL